jgi:hypothetical protein
VCFPSTVRRRHGSIDRPSLDTSEHSTERKTAVNILIVYVQPEQRSRKDVATETLRRTGHKVVVSDLCTMDFNPVVGPADFTGEPAGTLNTEPL